MVTKWKNIKKILTGKQAALLYSIFSIILLMVNIWLGLTKGLYFTKLVIINFVLIILVIATGIKSALCYIFNNAENENDEVFNKIYYKIMITEFIGCILYTVIISAILVLGHTYNDDISFFDTLMMYHMGWIIFCIYFIPVFCSLFEVYLVSDKYRTNRLLMKEHEATLKIEKSDKFRTELLTNVTHDLKTPLTSIISYIALMEKEELSPIMQDYVTAISKKSTLLKEMIENVFDISKASSGNANLKIVSLDMNRLVMQVLDDVSDSYQEQQVNFKMELSDENTLFLGDSMFVYRIVQNLLVNAIKYSMDGTRIFIKTFVQDKKIFLQVLNTTKYPIEVDANDLKEKFVRGDKSRSTEGNGLGLAIVDAYVQALGGNFTIDVIGDTFKASITFDKEYVA